MNNQNFNFDPTDFYLPKTLYNNVKALANKKHTSISSTMTECIEYAIENNIIWAPDKITVPDKINRVPAVHFLPKYTSTKLQKTLLKYNLNNAQVIQAIQYGAYYLDK